MSTENENDGWIKMSERKPTPDQAKAGCLLWHTRPRNENGGWVDLVRWDHKQYDPTKTCEITHWQPAQLPAPPKPEPTQRDEDEAALWAWIKVKDDKHENVYAAAWHAALAHRDAQNRQDIDLLGPVIASGSLHRLRKRCGLQ